MSIVLSFHRQAAWDMGIGEAAYYLFVQVGWVSITITRGTIESTLARLESDNRSQHGGGEG